MQVMTTAMPGIGLVMAGDRLGGRPVQAFDVMDESHVAFDKLSSSYHVVRPKRFLRHEIMEASVESVSHSLGQQPCYLVKRASFNGFVGGRDRRSEVTAGRLEPGIRSTFSRSMDPH
jgi:hypothetical protein